MDIDELAAELDHGLGSREASPLYGPLLQLLARGEPVSVESACHGTGAPVRVTVDPAAGVTSVDPATAVVSIVTPGEHSSIRTAFCNQVHFFASRQAARPWLDEHPGMTVLPAVDAHRLGQSLLPALLEAPTSDPTAAEGGPQN
jgi:alkylmercury lyase